MPRLALRAPRSRSALNAPRSTLRAQRSALRAPLHNVQARGGLDTCHGSDASPAPRTITSSLSPRSEARLRSERRRLPPTLPSPPCPCSFLRKRLCSAPDDVRAPPTVWRRRLDEHPPRRVPFQMKAAALARLSFASSVIVLAAQNRLGLRSDRCPVPSGAARSSPLPGTSTSEPGEEGGLRSRRG